MNQKVFILGEENFKSLSKQLINFLKIHSIVVSDTLKEANLIINLTMDKFKNSLAVSVPVINALGKLNNVHKGTEIEEHEYSIPPVYRTCIDEILSKFKDYKKAFVTVLQPSGNYFSSNNGPIDSIILDESEKLNDKCTILKCTIPHTRCYLLGFNIYLNQMATKEAIINLFKEIPNSWITPQGIGLHDTANLTELFRDTKYSDGSFMEIVLFSESVNSVNFQVQFWVSVHQNYIFYEILNKTLEYLKKS